jgi:hypothetical protein
VREVWHRSVFCPEEFLCDLLQWSSTLRILFKNALVECKLLLNYWHHVRSIAQGIFNRKRQHVYFIEIIFQICY